MKLKLICWTGILAVLAIIACPNSGFTGAPTTASTQTARGQIKPSGDASTDLVLSFYSVLMQEDEPTAAQEDEIFDTTLAKDLRTHIMLQAKYASARAPILQFLRDHKDWFFPKNMKSVKEVQISSEIHFLRNLDHVKDSPKPGTGWVMAYFVDDRNAVPPRFRTIVFQTWNLRIDPSEIRLSGFESKTISEEILGH